jgi:hypothetical protein
MLTAIFLALLLSPPSESRPSHTQQVATAVQVLSGAEPHGLTWRYSQHLDINCDGSLDEFFTAKDSTRAYVAVVLGPISTAAKHSIIALRLDRGSQDGLCGPIESLTPETLSTAKELLEMVGQEPEGYRYSRKCRGLSLGAGECDRFHLFWNHAEGILDWWRL